MALARRVDVANREEVSSFATAVHERVEALVAAGRAKDGDFAAMSTTRRQLAELIDLLGLDRALLEPLSAPSVVHFCGHRVSPDAAGGRFPVSEMPSPRDVERVLLFPEDAVSASSA